MENKRLFHKNFTLVVIGQIISLFGNGIIRFALPLHLLNQTGSATLFGIVTALSFLPMILLTPIGGIIADRMNKRNIMVTLDFLTAGLMAVFFLLLGKVDLVALLIATLMLLYGIQGAYQPAVQASMPLLHGKENLLAANAIINQVNSLAGLLAPILGGILFGLWGLTPIILVGGGCFLISAVMEIFITIPHTKEKDKQGIFKIVRQDFSESFSFMRKDKPVILKSIGIICAFNLFLSAMLLVSMPVLITQTLGMSDQLYGYSQGALAAGGVFGGIFVSAFGKKLNIKKLYILLLTTAVLLLPMAVSLWLGLSPFVSYLVISTSCFLLMSVATMVTVQMLTFIQGETPTQLIGKVVACVMALAMCAQPLGQAMYGYLFDAFKDIPYIVIFGAAFLSGAIALLSKKVFQNIN
ncbi:MAG: MFS transporter [Lachnospiraceae bacterium]|nr:MFS transporter [Lachnospiraceae bacterium]